MTSSWRPCPDCAGTGQGPHLVRTPFGALATICGWCGGTGQTPPRRWADPRSGAGWDGEMPPRVAAVSHEDGADLMLAGRAGHLLDGREHREWPR